MKYYAFTKENMLDNIFNQIYFNKIQKNFFNLEKSFLKSVRYVLVGASLVAKLVKNPPAVQETLVRFLGHKDPLEKGQATHSSILGLPWWFSRQRICLQSGRPGFDPWVWEDPLAEGEHGNPLQYSCLENPHGQRSLVGCSPWGHKEMDVIGQLRTQLNHFSVHLKLIQYCKSTILQQKFKRNQKLESSALLRQFLGHMTLDEK